MLSLMRNSIVKRFLSPTRSSYEAKQRSIFIGLAMGVIGLISAVAVVILSNSLTVLSDLMRNVGVVFAIFFSWMAVQRGAKGKNFFYNYGYGKMENLSSLIVAGVLIVSIIIIIYQTVDRFQNPVALKEVGTGIGIALSALAGISNAWLSWQSRKNAKRETSPVMESLYRLYQVKTLSTVCVVASLSLSLALRNQPWAVYIDPIGSVVLLVFMVYATYGVISSSVFDLLDRTLSDSIQLIVLQSLASHFDAYDAIHGVRSRRSGTNVYVELFLEFDPDSKMSEVQKSIDELKAELETRIPGSQIIIVPTTSQP